MRAKLILLFHLVYFPIFCAGCSGPVKFAYLHPVIQPSSSSGLIVAVAEIDDQRTNREVDAIFAQKPLSEVNKILVEEIQSAGLFDKVYNISGDQIEDEEYLLTQDIDLVAKPVLTVMKLMPPGMDDILEKGYTATRLGGMPCGCLFGSVAADYRGYIRLKFELTDLNSGTPYLENDYVGVARRKASAARFSNEVKASLIAEALRTAMTELKADLTEKIDKIRGSKLKKAILGSCAIILSRN